MLALRIALGIISIVAVISERLLDILSTTREIKVEYSEICIAISFFTGLAFAIWSFISLFLPTAHVVRDPLIFTIWIFLMYIFGKNA